MLYLSNPKRILKIGRLKQKIKGGRGTDGQSDEQTDGQNVKQLYHQCHAFQTKKEF